ncbi:MAG: hypothetical protein GF347_01350 [Candidatus Moranbacteria bacterium]|nr:hypothetical protein [Candidatus Moranbacteria bacterium]
MQGSLISDNLSRSLSNSFYKKENINYKFEVSDLVILKNEILISRFKKRVFLIKEHLIDLINRIWGRERGGVVIALLLGEKGYMDDQLKKSISSAGISHIFAISGMHIAIIIDIIAFLLASLNFKRFRIFLLVNLLLFFYLNLIGFLSSACRAYLMFNFNTLGALLGRRVYKNSILLLALNIILAFNPRLLFYDIGLQLSFLASFSLINFYPGISGLIHKFFNLEKINPIFKRFIHYAMGVLIGSLCVFLATFPLLLYYFDYLSLATFVSNLIFVWIIPFLILFLILSLICFYISDWLLDLLVSITNFIFDCFNFLLDEIVAFDFLLLKDFSLSFLVWAVWIFLFFNLLLFNKDLKKDFDLIKNF